MANTREISTEELYMRYYFEELLEEGLIKKIIHQPEPIILSDKLIIPVTKQLKTKVKKEFKTLLNPHVYTPDFLIHWMDENKLHKDFSNDYFEEKFPIFFSTMFRSFVEVKADSRFDNNMTRLFTTRTQPWVYQKHDIFINLIKVPDIFKETFIPKKILPDFFYKVNGKKFKKGDKKYNWKYKTLKEYLNE